MKNDPNLAERLLARLGFALSLPTLGPIALLMAALARVQRGNALVRAVLTPVLGTAVFLAFIVTILVFAPYYILMRIGGALGIVDISVPKTFDVEDIVAEGTFETFAVNCSGPHKDKALAVAMLTGVVTAVAAGENLQYFRLPQHSSEVYGPFTTASSDIESRLWSFVESIDYGASASCWFVIGPASDDLAFDLGALSASWNADLVETILDGVAVFCHIETMIDQGSQNSRAVVCGRGERLRRTRSALQSNA